MNCLTTLGESMIGIITSISTKETNTLIYKPQNFSMYVTSSLMSSLSIFPLYAPVDYWDLVFGLIIGAVLLVDAVALLSMTRLGYYTALVSSAILLGGCVFLFFWFILFFLINLGSLTLGIITIAYLLGDAKYEYPI